jgi:hypothetical protein
MPRQDLFAQGPRLHRPREISPSPATARSILHRAALVPRLLHHVGFSNRDCVGSLNPLSHQLLRLGPCRVLDSFATPASLTETVLGPQFLRCAGSSTLLRRDMSSVSPLAPVVDPSDVVANAAPLRAFASSPVDVDTSPTTGTTKTERTRS